MGGDPRKHSEGTELRQGREPNQQRRTYEQVVAVDIWGGPTGDPLRDWVEHTSEASHPWQDARVCTHKASLLGRSLGQLQDEE